MEFEKLIKLDGVELNVEGYFQPEEAMVMYYKDGSGYSGCPASIEIHNIYIEDTNVTELLESRIEEIENILFNEL